MEGNDVTPFVKDQLLDRVIGIPPRCKIEGCPGLIQQRIQLGTLKMRFIPRRRRPPIFIEELISRALDPRESG